MDSEEEFESADEEDEKPESHTMPEPEQALVEEIGEDSVSPPVEATTEAPVPQGEQPLSEEGELNLLNLLYYLYNIYLWQFCVMFEKS